MGCAKTAPELKTDLVPADESLGSRWVVARHAVGEETPGGGSI